MVASGRDVLLGRAENRAWRRTAVGSAFTKGLCCGRGWDALALRELLHNMRERCSLQAKEAYGERCVLHNFGLEGICD